jgi:hypothetical protein
LQFPVAGQGSKPIGRLESCARLESFVRPESLGLPESFAPLLVPPELPPEPPSAGEFALLVASPEPLSDSDPLLAAPAPAAPRLVLASSS